PARGDSGEMDRVVPIGLPTLRRGREVWSVTFSRRTLPVQLLLGLRRVGTGGVEISDEGRTLYLELRGGRIVAAHDSTGQHPLGRLLVEESILDAARVSSAIAACRQANLRLGEYLVVERHIRQSALERLLRLQMERRLASCFDYEGGRLVTLIGDGAQAQVPDAEQLPESVVQVVAALREGLSQAALVHHLEPVLDAIVLPAPGPFDVTSLGLTGPEGRALTTVLEGGALEGRSARKVVETLVEERLARPAEARFALLVGLWLGAIRASGFGRD
ncbi:MAG TPA: DUF4388 domain-containing protein, partial [Polyangiaceae bacterium]|nr:DUF4388 domain-containing protein [Polyangiaceae bacterium]